MQRNHVRCLLSLAIVCVMGMQTICNVSVIAAKRETLSFPIPFTREAAPSATEQRERCRGRTVRAQGVDAGRRLPIRAGMIVEEQKRMEETRRPIGPPVQARGPSENC